MRSFKGTVFAIVVASLLMGCKSDAEHVDELPVEYKESKEEVVFEDLMAAIDMNDTLSRGNSLFYTKPNGASIEVYIYVNEKGETVKMIESYIDAGSSSICSNTFYFKEGARFASVEKFEDGTGEDAHFVERVSFYDEQDNPIISKSRSALFEEELDFEEYKSIDVYDCSMERALSVLNQSGPFATTFQGFVKEEPFTYIIVGENNKEGYSSSLVVQNVDRTIQVLTENEAEMIGKAVIIEFETVGSAEGYEYQILHHVALR